MYKKHNDSSATFRVVWRAFQLRPDASVVRSENKIDVYTKLFGREKFERMLMVLKSMGLQDGI